MWNGWGGARAGAGAPKQNINALRSGRRSARIAEIKKCEKKIVAKAKRAFGGDVELYMHWHFRLQQLREKHAGVLQRVARHREAVRAKKAAEAATQ